MEHQKSYLANLLDYAPKALVRGTLAALVAVTFASQKTEALSPSNAVLYTQMTLAQIANDPTALDTDSDGLSDDFENNLALHPAITMNPNLVDSNDDGLEDNAYTSAGGLDTLGQTNFNYQELQQDITAPVGEHNFPLCFSRDGKSIYFMHTTNNPGTPGNPALPLIYKFPVLYKMSVGQPGTESQLTNLGDLGNFYEFNRGSPNATDTGVYLHLNDTGIYGSGGKVVEVTDAGKIITMLDFQDGRKAINPALVIYGKNQYLLAAIRDDYAADAISGYVSAFQLDATGIPNLVTEQKVIDQRVPAGSHSKATIFNIIPNNFGLNSTEIAWTAVRGSDSFFIYHSVDGALESKIKTAATYTNDQAAGEDSFLIGGAGFFATGWNGLDLIISQDMSQNLGVGIFNISTTNFNETDFNLRISSPVSGQHTYVMKQGNQFFHVQGPYGLAFSSIDQTGHSQLQIAQLKAVTYMQFSSGTAPWDIVYTDLAGNKNTIPQGTTWNIPGGRKYLTQTPAVSIIDISTAPAGFDAVLQPIIHAPSGTTFTSSAKSTTYGQIVIAPLNLFLLEKELLEEATIQPMKYNDSTGLFDIPLQVLDRNTTDNQVADMPAHSVKYQNLTYSVSGLAAKIDPDFDQDGLSNDFETANGLNPAEADSDHDGTPDYDEVNWDGNPNDYNPYNPDTNPTGTDLDANSTDTDQDGQSDSFEREHGSNPLDPYDVVSVPVGGWCGQGIGAALLALFGARAIRKRNLQPQQ